MLHVGDTSCLEPGGCGLLPWGLIKDYACEMNGSPPLGFVTVHRELIVYLHQLATRVHSLT